MNALYHLWHAGVNTPHHTKYYNTRYWKMYWIHGGNCPTDEPVTTEEESGIEQGFEDMTDGDRIIDRLNESKHEEFTFDLIPYRTIKGCSKTLPFVLFLSPHLFLS